MVQCVKLGREAEGLDRPTYPGELGKRIYENVSKEAWAQWIRHQTMLVNENRLNLADAKARKYLVEQMEKHFFGDGADAARLRPAEELSTAGAPPASGRGARAADAAGDRTDRRLSTRPKHRLARHPCRFR
jgi:Fe-S cluster biosynthesis and repair protein YggX